MYDLILLCVNQKRASKNIPNNKNIHLELNEKYFEIWKFMSLTDGIWYNLLANKNEIGGTSICKYLDENKTLKLNWIDKKFLDDCTPYIIDSYYIDSFTAVLKHLISESPVKMVYILARYQCYDKEIVLGSFTIDEFLNNMKNEKIFSNVCYIVSGNKTVFLD